MPSWSLSADELKRVAKIARYVEGRSEAEATRTILEVSSIPLRVWVAERDGQPQPQPSPAGSDPARIGLIITDGRVTGTRIG